jgi:hypothetical protein
LNELANKSEKLAPGCRGRTDPGMPFPEPETALASTIIESVEGSGSPEKISRVLRHAGAFYEFSITYTESQQLPRRFNDLREPVD